MRYLSINNKIASDNFSRVDLIYLIGYIENQTYEYNQQKIPEYFNKTWGCLHFLIKK